MLVDFAFFHSSHAKKCEHGEKQEHYSEADEVFHGRFVVI